MSSVKYHSRYIIVTIRDGQIDWISQARTERGAQASKRNSMKYRAAMRPNGQYEVRIIAMEDVLEWDKIREEAEKYRALALNLDSKRRIVVEE
jgi:hypothetical protein